MAEITITTDELSDAQNFLVQYLRDAGYDGSLEDGTAVYDIIVKGMSLLYLLFKKDVDKAQSYLSIASALKNSELLGDELDTVIDTILGNWFVTRKGGTRTTGRVRLVYSHPRDFTTLLATIPIIAINSVMFVPEVDVSFSAENFGSVINSIGTGLEYYVELDVVSIDNDSTEILVGTAIQSYLADIYFLRAEITENFTPGTLQEGNDGFIFRTQKAITTRELITERAIETVLMDEFSGVDSIYVAGHGDPEQMRDHTIFADENSNINVQVHVGNKSDIYVGCDLTQTVLEFVMPDTNIITLDAYFAEIITADLVTVIDDVETLESVVYLWDDVEEGYFGAVGNPVSLSIPECIEGDLIRLTVLSHLLPVQIENFVTDKEQRVSCYDPIVKTKFPVILEIGFGAVASADGLTTSDIEALIASEVTNFVIGLKSGDVFILSELIRYLHNTVSCLYQVQLPITVDYTFTDPKSRERVTGSLVNEFSIPTTLNDEITALSNQISWKTIQFYTSTNLLNITVTS